MVQMLVRTVLFSIAFGLGLILLWSIITSGMSYMYDGDEVYHAQLTYLYANGYRPFTSVYVVYSPLYNALLIPVFRATGFTFEALRVTRIIMVILFIVRLLLSYILAKKLFGKITAILFIILLLLDPFTVFSSMQIRPDNLMIVVFTLGLVVLVLARSKWWTIAAGVLVALAFLINVKIFPSLMLLILIYIYNSLATKKWRQLRLLTVGCCISFTLFSLYFILTNSFGPMVQQMIIEPQKFLATTVYPTRLGFFFAPDNIYIYGLPGKPLTWIYAWVLPFIGFGGALLQAKEKFSPIRIYLTLTLVAQWLLLFTLQTAFIQYYTPVNWLFALFGAYAIVSFMKAFKTRRLLYTLSLIAITIAILSLTRVSIEANYARSTMRGSDVVAKFERIWERIPQDSAVFPDFLFRPLGYPMTSGYVIGVRTRELQNRYGDVSDYLEKNHVSFVFRNTYMADYYSPQTNAYIDSHFMKDPGIEELYFRN